MFLLVPAYPGCPGPKAGRETVVLVACYVVRLAAELMFIFFLCITSLVLAV